MTPAALIMMVVAILLIWGGLVAAIAHLRANPDMSEASDESPGHGIHRAD